MRCDSPYEKNGFLEKRTTKAQRLIDLIGIKFRWPDGQVCGVGKLSPSQVVQVWQRFSPAGVFLTIARSKNNGICLA